MLIGNNPQRSLQYFDRLGLYQTVFTDPTSRDMPAPDTTNWSLAYNCLRTLESNKTPGSIYQTFVRSDDARYALWMLAALAPWSSLPNPKKTGSKTLPLFGTRVAQEGVKANSKVCAHVDGAFKNYADITDLKNAVTLERPFINDRDIVGMNIRKWDADGGNWRIQALFALLVEAMSHSTSSGAGIDALLSGWQALIDHLEKMDIMDAPLEKPLINGKILMREINAARGPWIKAALDICMAWQLRNPDSRGPESVKAAISEVKKRSKELDIPADG
jgi:tRNA nucleotidyltransferase (CCA-adding enzyme)